MAGIARDRTGIAGDRVWIARDKWHNSLPTTNFISPYFFFIMNNWAEYSAVFLIIQLSSESAVCRTTTATVGVLKINHQTMRIEDWQY